MNFNDVDDELLMTQIGQQQEMALRELYRRHGQLLFSVAYHIINNG